MNKKAKQIQVTGDTRRRGHRQIAQLFENCIIDKISGRFHCKKCDNLIQVNLAERVVFCSVYGMLIEEDGYGFFI